MIAYDDITTESISTIVDEYRSVTIERKTRAVAGIGLFRGACPRLEAWPAFSVW